MRNTLISVTVRLKNITNGGTDMLILLPTGELVEESVAGGPQIYSTAERNLVDDIQHAISAFGDDVIHDEEDSVFDWAPLT